ncbi:MAG: HAD family phosphatase [Clostridia bacterium]
MKNNLANLIKNKQTLIFDLDGTIANTEVLHWEAYNQLLGAYNVCLTNNDIAKYIGKTEWQIYKMIKADFNIDFDEQQFICERHKIYLSLVKNKNLQTFKYFNEVINLDKKFYLLSSQDYNIIINTLTHLNILNKFAKLVSLADVSLKKSDYLSDIKKYYDTTIDDVVLFEDAAATLAFAKKQGIATVGISHTFNHLTSDCCDIIIKND